jgi:hypothetical protein
MTRLFLRLAVFAGLVLPLQIVTGNLLESHAFASRDTLDAILAEHADTVMLGDSTTTWMNPQDADRRTIALMLSDLLPGRKVRLCEEDGSHLTIYEYHVAHLCRSESRPREIVILVNVRSFSPIWDLSPGLQARRDILRYRLGDVLALGLVRPLERFGIYKLHPLSLEDWGNIPIFRGEVRWGTIYEANGGHGVLEGKSYLERKFTMDYLNPLPPTHRKLRSLVNIVRTCKASGVRPIVYVTPLDVESGQQAVGPDLVTQVQKNVEVVRKTLEPEGVPLLDLSRSLAARDFDWFRQKNPNEHLKQSGRLLVAENLAAEILRSASPPQKP